MKWNAGCSVIKGKGEDARCCLCFSPASFPVAMHPRESPAGVPYCHNSFHPLLKLQGRGQGHVHFFKVSRPLHRPVSKYLKTIPDVFALLPQGAHTRSPRGFSLQGPILYYSVGFGPHMRQNWSKVCQCLDVGRRTRFCHTEQLISRSQQSEICQKKKKWMEA